MTLSSYRAARPDGPLEEEELVALVHSKLQTSLNREEGSVSNTRERNLSYYFGEPDGSERPGYSQYITREVYEFVEWALPSCLSTLHNYNSLEFEPSSPDYADSARQATDYIRHLMFVEGNGYMASHDFIKSGLIDPVAYAKVYAKPIVKVLEEEYRGLTQEQAIMLLNDPEVEVLENSAEQEGPQPPIINLRIRRYKEEFKPTYEAVPPEEVRVDANWSKLDLEGCPFVAHTTEVDFTTLVQEYGYDEDELNEAGGSVEDTRYLTEKANRFFHEEERRDLYGDGDEEYATRKFERHEVWLYIDADGDGRAERRRMVIIGSKIFENEIDDYCPMVAMSGVPVPHKHVGLAPASVVVEDQRLSTAVTRQLLDNAYKLNRGRMYYNRRAFRHAEDALRNTQEEHVGIDGPVQGNVMFDQPQPFIQQLMPVLEHVRQVKSAHTGVAPENALNPDVLRDAAAHNMLMSQDKASDRLMHLVRTFAETGFKRVAEKFYRLIRMYQDVPKLIQLRGEWQTVDPRSWDDNVHCRVKVGLGFNDKVREAAQLEKTLQFLIDVGLPQGAAKYEHVHRTFRKLVEATKMGHVDEYLVPPDQYQPPQPEPPPEVQLEMEKAKAEAAARQKELEIEEAKVQADTYRIKAQADEDIAKTRREDMKSALTLEAQREEIRKTTVETQKLQAEISKLLAEIDQLRKQPAEPSEEGGGQ